MEKSLLFLSLAILSASCSAEPVSSQNWSSYPDCVIKNTFPDPLSKYGGQDWIAADVRFTKVQTEEDGHHVRMRTRYMYQDCSWEWEYNETLECFEYDSQVVDQDYPELGIYKYFGLSTTENLNTAAKAPGESGYPIQFPGVKPYDYWQTDEYDIWDDNFYLTGYSETQVNTWIENIDYFVEQKRKRLDYNAEVCQTLILD